MSEIIEIYNNLTIRIQNDNQLSIEGKSIPLILDHETNQWSSSLLPYTEYSDLTVLAKQIIDDSEEFRK